MIKQCAFILRISGLFILASSGQAAETPAPSADVLVIDGFSNHDWQKTTKAIQGVFAPRKDFKLKTTTVPAQGSADWDAWLPEFSSYDVVIQTCNDLGNGRSWPVAAREALEKYVKDGGGLLIYHSANNAFSNWPAYNDMIGLGWRKKDFGVAIEVIDHKIKRIPAGKGAGTGHGKRVDALVTRMGDHPIHKNLPAAWIAADIEVYRYARGPAKNLTVLSYAKDASTGMNFPMAWTVNYGNGRVFNSTYGHYWKNQNNPPGIRCVAFRTLLVRATQWLAKRPVNDKVPDNFPSDQAPSLTSIR